ncbi:MAG: hypothetical protein ACI8VC_000962 [Candidatus Endobugula sp.]
MQGTFECFLSGQQSAVNFRCRESDASYASDSYMVDDPSLLVILSGTLCIELHNGNNRQFSLVEYFIVEDYLSDTAVFDKTFDGHRVYFLGGKPLSALHLKLAQRVQS